MSHWAQENKNQEENEELRARNFPANGAAGGIRTHTPLIYICAH